MKSDQEIERIFLKEFQNLTPNLIWPNEEGYEVFGHYQIQPLTPGYRVVCGISEVGEFSSTRTALSWCIADKYQSFNTAREILRLDNKLTQLKNDIHTRAAIGDRSKNPGLRETILTKLESKIIQKKLLENQLNKLINWAKYIQQRGFEDETQRSGRSQPNKTSR